MNVRRHAPPVGESLREGALSARFRRLSFSTLLTGILNAASAVDLDRPPVQPAAAGGGLDRPLSFDPPVALARHPPGHLVTTLAAVGGALLLTLLSYGCLCCYDLLALKVLDKRLPWQQVGMTSFIAYTFSNTLGFALLTGSSVRYRLYSSLGLGTGEVARVILFAPSPSSSVCWAGGSALLLGQGRPCWWTGPAGRPGCCNWRGAWPC